MSQLLPISPNILPSDRLPDYYDSTHQIGKGGLGMVWRGQDRSSHSPVAIKRQARTPQARAEAVMLQRLKAPHAVHCRHVFEDYEEKPNPKSYIVMDLIPEQNIAAAFLGSDPLQRTLNFQEIKCVTKQLLEFLVDLRKANIVYFDLKSSNMIYRRESRSLTMIDMGSARQLPLERSLGISTTPTYSAPELMLGKPITIDYDLWSLGCTIFLFLTNTYLFEIPGGLSKEAMNHYLLQMIFKQIGPPSDEYLVGCPNQDIFFDKDFNFIWKADLPTIQNWKDRVIDSACQKEWPRQEVLMFIDILDRLLCYENRATPESLLVHPLFENEITVHLSYDPKQKCQMYIFRAADELMPHLILDFDQTTPTCLHLLKDPQGKYEVVLMKGTTSVTKPYSLKDHDSLDIRKVQKIFDVSMHSVKRQLFLPGEKDDLDTERAPKKPRTD